MLKIEFTYHAQVERIDRLVACVQYLGMNEIIREMPDRYHNAGKNKRCLTDTGIVLVISEDGKLITGFMGTVAQVASFYKGEKIPPSVLNRAKKNEQKYKWLLKM